MLQADRFAAVVAEIRANCVKCAAIFTEDFGRIERIHLDLRTTVFTICPEMLEAFEVTALTLPVADLILNVLKRRGLAEIRDREDRGKYRLETDVIALFRDQIHLQESVVRFTLDLDQIRDLGCRVDL